ncbi:MAG: M50 family metallopeptidase [Bifidobacterium tibiigranuli]|jgi:hypothetical protein|uniref:M50 family metallopeptidase n=1 Tax=Bifidobacterium tibiigranuli TaxID=2172043 RepID=UPI0026F1E59C|nr:M50 family metallopeptidase [Bifidobacterium tibiigranuli]MCI1673745.1 M50 family metallopeptidase [Bifidobacterium tibiigranuli]MCI1711994.1 M50 family metallopeptidase [Bifidobacterium tibiigranuli]
MTFALFQNEGSQLGGALQSIWASSTTRLSPLDARGILLCVLIALAAVLIGPAWRVTRNAITIAHEGGHALIAVLTGRKLESIRLHADTSGVTVSAGRVRGLGLALTTFAGYIAPALWGLGCAALVANGFATAALWLLVVLLAFMLVRIRNGYGFLAIIVALALTIVISWWGAAAMRNYAGYTLAWFLCFGAIRPLFELYRQRATRGARDSDADMLAQDTGIPATLWILLWLALDCGALWLAAHWMTQDAGGIAAVFSPNGLGRGILQ